MREIIKIEWSKREGPIQTKRFSFELPMTDDMMVASQLMEAFILSLTQIKEALEHDDLEDEEVVGHA